MITVVLHPELGLRRGPLGTALVAGVHLAGDGAGRSAALGAQYAPGTAGALLAATTVAARLMTAGGRADAAEGPR
ncbi:hypothetical protein [Kitasatospora sp. NPDC093679]|uniref:hypothetical protein n=1 Tax=Kitasatospora sp. NPDC093679 TaxID=3154983 RepID=UPI003426B64F